MRIAPIAAACLFGGLPCALWAGAAAAQECEGSGTVAQPCSDHATEALLLPTGTAGLSGAHIYSEVVIGGTVVVDAADATDERTGWLWLRAARIEITASGIIDANAKGYGVNAGPGAGVTVSMTTPSYDPFPGGGGSHAGPGGQGLAGPDSMDTTCMTPFPGVDCDLFAAALGGPIYDVNPLMPAALDDPRLGMGSAGGASLGGCPNEDALRAGKFGGGVVVLTAAEVIIDGVVRANGVASSPEQGAGPGAGAGGSVVIQALTASGAGTLSARGGDGLTLTATRQSYGGAGGGGLISLIANGADTLLLAADVAGGAIATACVAQTAGLAGPGAKAIVPPAPCLDADLDGYSVCSDGSGDDCDDGRPGINPDNCEICNGLDDDCSGTADDDPSASCSEPLCPAGTGYICDDGECQTVGEGGGGAGAAPPVDPPALRLGGGLCAASYGSDDSARWLAWAALAAFCIWRRRR